MTGTTLLFSCLALSATGAFGALTANQLYIDCHTEPAATQQNCEARGCVWNVISPPGEGQAPWCQFANADDPTKMAGYEASGGGVGANDVYMAKLTRRPTSTLYGGDYQKATVKIEQLTDQILKVLVWDQQESAKRAKKPDWRQNLLENGVVRNSRVGDGPWLDVVVDKSPFGLAIFRRATKVPLIDTRALPGFTFAEQYQQISMRVPTRNVYGLGETTHNQLRHDFQYRKWGLFARDVGPGNSNINLYGVHAFYLCIDDQSGNAHGVFFLNTHALNVELQPDPFNPNGGIITWRATGGALEFFLFAGPTPADVISQYTSIIGRPQLPPYWAMGFQLSRYGYKNLTFLNTIFERNRKANIPQDTQVIDIDYMYQYYDFTTDPVAFANISGFLQSLHDQYKMKFVPIVDPGIPNHPTVSYDPLTKGLQSNVFIRDNRTGKPLEGKVWPGLTFYPDFSHPNTTAWWTASVANFYKGSAQNQATRFDGLWIDMNEPSNFVVGSTSGCANNSLNKPPYNPLIYDDINEKTLCMDADHYAGKHYEYHNLYGYEESQATYAALQAVFPSKRPFVLSRSTFAGSGKYTNHWLGDNASQWSQLKQSIIGMLEFNLFGIPLVGADICGFGGTATEEMCVRWSQTGAFYPFSRNHNTIDSTREQDPASWSANATAAIRNALNIRYGLLPYLYTLLYHAHVNGTPVARATFFDFANDPNTLGLDDQFLWGHGLLVAPITDASTVHRTVYFPRGRWYDFLSHTEVPRWDVGRALDVPMPLDTFGLYLRGGVIIPWQAPNVTTAFSRANPFTILVGLCDMGRAWGDLFWDDGETLDGLSSYFQFQAWSSGNRGGINVTMVRNDFGIDQPLNHAVVYGVPTSPTSVTLDGTAVPPASIKFNNQTNALSLDNLNIKLNWDHQIVWTF